MIIYNPTPAEAQRLCELAIGRILRLGSRPYQEGDIREYEDARAVLLEFAPIARQRPCDLTSQVSCHGGWDFEFLSRRLKVERAWGPRRPEIRTS